MWFWEGLPVEARQAISCCLELQNPRTFSHSDPIDYDDDLEAGQFIFSDEAFNVDVYNPVLTRFKTLHPSEPHVPKKSAHLPSSSCLHLAPESDDEEDHCIPSALQDIYTKTVRINAANPIPKSTPADELEELGRRMHSLSIEDSAYAGCYTRMVFLVLTIAQMYTPPARMRPVHAAPTQHLFSASVAPPAPMYPLLSTKCFMCGGLH